MYSSSLRAAASSSGGAGRLRLALGRLGGGAVAAPAGWAVHGSRGRRRSAFSTSAASSGMEQPQPKQEDAVGGENKTRDSAHKSHWDPMTQSFGEGYSTRADEEGFGTVYARGHDDDHPGHTEYDTSQGHEVREEEKGRHLKDDKHAT